MYALLASLAQEEHPQVVDRQSEPSTKISCPVFDIDPALVTLVERKQHVLCKLLALLSNLCSVLKLVPIAKQILWNSRCKKYSFRTIIQKYAMCMAQCVTWTKMDDVGLIDF